MREIRSSGSVEEVMGDHDYYSDWSIGHPACTAHGFFPATAPPMQRNFAKLLNRSELEPGLGARAQSWVAESQGKGIRRGAGVFPPHWKTRREHSSRQPLLGESC